MSTSRGLELRDVTAVELEMPGAGEDLLDVLHERDRNQTILLAPDKERVCLELLHPSPQTLLAARLVEVDVAGGLIESDPAAGAQVGAEELVDACRRPALATAGNE